MYLRSRRTSVPYNQAAEQLRSTPANGPESDLDIKKSS